MLCILCSTFLCFVCVLQIKQWSQVKSAIPNMDSYETTHSLRSFATLARSLLEWKVVLWRYAIRITTFKQLVFIWNIKLEDLMTSTKATYPKQDIVRPHCRFFFNPADCRISILSYNVFKKNIKLITSLCFLYCSQFTYITSQVTKSQTREARSCSVL